MSLIDDAISSKDLLEFLERMDRVLEVYGGTRRNERDRSEAIEDLSRHGRKYGLGVCISTQRIAHLNTNILQQLHTYFVDTLLRPYDHGYVSDVCTSDRDMLDKTLELGKGEWIISSNSATEMPNISRKLLRLITLSKFCMNSWKGEKR
jgi:DNA helicase HerA-like ATPase